MRLTLYRDLPQEGWPSMEVYADNLAQALREGGFPELELREFREQGWRLPLPFNLPRYLSRALRYPRLARGAQGEINHVLDHSYGHLVPFLDPQRTVVTCHDLVPLIFRPSLPRVSLSVALWDWAFQGMLQAARILTVSHRTREDLLRYSDYDAARVKVAPLGVDPSFQPLADPSLLGAARLRHRLPPPPLLLHVGNCSPRKNLETLLQALAILRRQGSPVSLVQVGGTFSSRQRRLIGELGLEHAVVQIPHLEGRRELVIVYNLADVLVFPSLYEGFGLPPLEAMACGVPVVCANTSCLPEVVGEAALMVEPRDHEALARAIEAILEGEALRRSLVQRGRERARAFTWERCAERTYAVYWELYQELYG